MARLIVLLAIALELGCDPAAANDAPDSASAQDGAALPNDAGAAVVDASPDSGSSFDAATGNDGDGGALRGIFVAVGQQARSIVSCDDGLTWIHNRSDDDTIRCGAGVDCDHNATAANGIAFGNAWFIANFGHGAPGTVRRTKVGLSWEVVDTGRDFAGMMFGNGHFIAAAGKGIISTDGAAWVDAAIARMGNPPMATTFRGGAFIGNGFVMVADGPTATFGVDGTSWNQLATLPGSCAGSAVVSGNGVLLVGGNPDLCRSSDHGASWTAVTLAATTPPLWDGSRFVAFGATDVFHSSDGLTWTPTPLKHTVNSLPAASPPLINVVARAPHGTFVAVSGGPIVKSYEQQRFYRSRDGITWDELGAGAFTGGHALRHIAWGPLQAGSVCPP